MTRRRVVWRGFIRVDGRDNVVRPVTGGLLTVEGRKLPVGYAPNLWPRVEIVVVERHPPKRKRR